MGGDVVSSWAWVVWIALILIFAVIEMLSLDFTFLMLAVGSVGGLVSGLLGAEWWLQIIVAAVLAIVLLFFVRPALHRRLHRGADPAKSNVEALIGQSGIVVQEIVHGAGQVKLANGETWTARPSEHVDVPAGSRVVVISIEGATAVVTAAPVASAPHPADPESTERTPS